jgi:hypothetical protein
MPKKYHRSYCCLLAVTIFLSACASLKPVNDFATASLLGAQKFETLPVSYQSLCMDNCKEQDIKSGKLNPSKCDCTTARLADSVDGLFYKTLAAYLDGLEKLSAGGTTDYKFDGVSDQLTGLGVSATDAGAYAKLGSILTKAITDGYRTRKIGAYITEANEPLQIIIVHLRANIGTSLYIDLEKNKSKLEGDYLDLVKKSNGNAFERRKIIEEFYTLKAGMESELKALKAYAALLQTIADGHRKLTDNLDKLDKAGLKDMITQYTSNIKDIRTQIQILTKK